MEKYLDTMLSGANYDKNLWKYSVILKDGLKFVSLYFKIRTSDSNEKCCSSLEVECWNEDETHAAQQSPTQF
jgi:hypothetical protein